jgi:acetyl esterase/lipase
MMLVRMILMLLLGVIIANAVVGQAVRRDTSFTVYSSYAKEKKKFPQIEIPSYDVPAGVVVKKDIVYCTLGERQLLVDVYAPAASKKNYAAVLLVFGGGWKSGNKDHWIPFAQQLAAKGYVAVAAEYRLSPEAKYPAAVHDLKAAVRWMRANAKAYNINKKRIAILGVSAGGQLAALVGTTNGNKHFEGRDCNTSKSSKVQAIVDIDGTLAFKHPESSEGVVAGEWLGGMYKDNPKNWEEAAPLNHVSKHTPPIVFINSSTPRFHAGRTDMIHKLDSLGIYSEVHEFPNTPHPFWFFHPWFPDVIKYTVDFLDKVLK